MRFLWSADYGHIDVVPAVAAQIHATAARLREAGAIVEEGGFSKEASWPWFLDFMRGAAIYGNAAPCFTNHPAFVEYCLSLENFVRLAEDTRVGLKTTPTTRETSEAEVDTSAARRAG